MYAQDFLLVCNLLVEIKSLQRVVCHGLTSVLAVVSLCLTFLGARKADDCCWRSKGEFGVLVLY